MKYDIFYFSGTGNSLSIARQIAENLGDSEIKKIKAPIDGLDASENIGLVFPVYMFGMPNIVREFLEKLEGAKRIFVVASHGGMPGAALYQAREIISRAGIELVGLYSVKMPDNYIPMFNGATAKEIERLLDDAKKQTDEIVGRIKSGNAQDDLKSIRSYMGFINKIGIKRIKKMGSGFHSDERCTKCGICQEICPVGNIYTEDGNPRWKNKCEGCMACIQWCPVESIQYKRKTQKKRRYRNPEVAIGDMISRGQNKFTKDDLGDIISKEE